MNPAIPTLFRAGFPSGFRPLVEDLLRRDFPDVQILDGDESSLACQIRGRLQDPGYCQSLARIIVHGTAGTMAQAAFLAVEALRERDGPAWQTMASIARDPAYSGRRTVRSFALRFFDQGSPCICPEHERRQLERLIGSAGNLQPDSARPDIELQLMLRSNNRASLQASWHRPRTDDRQAGALPASSARLLCELAGCRGEDVFLDPFAGSGAIPLERAKLGPCSLIFARDRQSGFVQAFRERIKESVAEKRRRTIFPKEADARTLDGLDTGFVHVIVTDPPWGHHAAVDDLPGLYRDFLAEAGRVLRDGGVLVMLVGREGPMDEIMPSLTDTWLLDKDWPVLIAGRKARVLRLLRQNRHNGESA